MPILIVSLVHLHCNIMFLWFATNDRRHRSYFSFSWAHIWVNGLPFLRRTFELTDSNIFGLVRPLIRFSILSPAFLFHCLLCKLPKFVICFGIKLGTHLQFFLSIHFSLEFCPHNMLSFSLVLLSAIIFLLLLSQSGPSLISAMISFLLWRVLN